MIINQKIKRLEDDADLAWHDGDEAEGARLDALVRELDAENERRLEAAKARLESFDQEAKDSGLLNASETSVKPLGGPPTFGSLGDRALQMCEFWELAAESAQAIVDFR
jgi:hypothetical protein